MIKYDHLAQLETLLELSILCGIIIKSGNANDRLRSACSVWWGRGSQQGVGCPPKKYNKTYPGHPGSRTNWERITDNRHQKRQQIYSSYFFCLFATLSLSLFLSLTAPQIIIYAYRNLNPAAFLWKLAVPLLVSSSSLLPLFFFFFPPRHSSFMERRQIFLKWNITSQLYYC